MIPTVEYETPVVLLGGADLDNSDLRALVDSRLPLICADGGGNTAVEFQLRPEMIIGDMDSFSKSFDGTIHHIKDQGSTDFEKCLSMISAPLYICYGFMGGRLDHELSNLMGLAKFSERSIILVGQSDVCFLCPNELSLNLESAGQRLSIYALHEARMRSTGLKWPLNDITLSPTSQMSISNESCSSVISLSQDAGYSVVVLPKKHLDKVARALAGG